MTAVCTHTHAHTCTRVGFLRTLTLVGLLAAPAPVLRCPRKTNQAVEFSPKQLFGKTPLFTFLSLSLLRKHACE